MIRAIADMGAKMDKRTWRGRMGIVAMGALAVLGTAQAGAPAAQAGLAPLAQGGPEARKEAQTQRDRMAEGPGALATRAAARVVAAADAAQAAGLKSDPASLARMGALPASLIKWGQVRSPWAEGQFLDVQYKGEGKSAKVAVVAPGIPNQLCQSSILELAMRPEIERVEAGSWSLVVGEKWSLKDVDGLCAALGAGPVKLWAKREAIER